MQLDAKEAMQLSQVERLHMVRNDPVMFAMIYKRRVRLLLQLLSKHDNLVGKVMDYGGDESQNRDNLHTHMEDWTERKLTDIVDPWANQEQGCCHYICILQER